MPQSNYPAGAENHPDNPWDFDDEQFLCPECSNPVSSEGMTCSLKCHKSSMR